MNRRSLAVAGGAVLLVAAVCGGCSDGTSSDGPSVSPTSAPAYGDPTREPSRSPASGPAAVEVRTGRLGAVLADAEGRTLYVFAADTSTESTCDDACAKAWPPLATSGRPEAEEGVSAGLLGTSRRSDGSSQVTYDGHPLYRYAGDERPGDTNGQELDQFGARWFAVTPSGERVEGG